jgi:hypothetical protein
MNTMTLVKSLARVAWRSVSFVAMALICLFCVLFVIVTHDDDSDDYWMDYQ